MKPKEPKHKMWLVEINLKEITSTMTSQPKFSKLKNQHLFGETKYCEHNQDGHHPHFQTMALNSKKVDRRKWITTQDSIYYKLNDTKKNESWPNFNTNVKKKNKMNLNNSTPKKWIQLHSKNSIQLNLNSIEFELNWIQNCIQSKLHSNGT